MTRLLHGLACLTALLVSLAVPAATALGQTYPTRAITIVVPFPPGGSVDILARLIGEKLAPALGQPVVIDNRSGATGTIGSAHVAKSAPDGHTLLLGTTGPVTMAPALTAGLTYDSSKDFSPIIQVGITPMVMVVNPALPAKSLSEFIAYAKSRQGKLNFVSSGTGTTGHLAGEMLKFMAGLEMVHVPYRGGAPAAQDLIAGQVELMFQLVPQMQPHIAAGQLRALGVTAEKRSKALPDVPTMIEQGYADFEVVTWFGVFAPAKTPDAIVERLNKEIARIVEAPDVSARLTELGSEYSPNSPKEFTDFIRRDLRKWKLVVDRSGLLAKSGK